MRTICFAAAATRACRLLAALTAGLALSTPSLLHAQPKPAATPAASASASQAAAPAASVDEATALFKQAIAADDAGKPAQAEELFLKAWALKKTWDIAANLGLVESRLGKHAAAAEHLTYAMRLVPPTETKAAKTELTKRLDAERAEVCAIKIRVSVAGAEVRVGGEVKGTAPLEDEVFAAPGSVTIEVKKDGYEPATQTIEAKKGGTQEVTLTLVAKQAPPPPGRSMVPAYAIGGVGFAALIAGGVLIGVAQSQRADLAKKLPHDESGNLVCVRTPPDANPECPTLRAQATQLDTLGNAGIATLAIGGVAVAVAAAYYFWPSPRAAQTTSATSVVPYAGREGGGLLWLGSF